MGRVRWADTAGIKMLLNECRPGLFIFLRCAVGTRRKGLRCVFQLDSAVDVSGQFINMWNRGENILIFFFNGVT
jgi:hypothetical protein